MAQDAAHVRVKLAQLGLAAMREQLADALERDPLLDLSLGDEADRLPVGRRWLAAAFGVRDDVVGDALAQRARERRQQQLAVLEDVDLRERELAALAIRARRLHEDEQAVGDLDDGGVERGPDAVLRGREHGVDDRIARTHGRPVIDGDP